jgi:hypothetical protein
MSAETEVIYLHTEAFVLKFSHSKRKMNNEGRRINGPAPSTLLIFGDYFLNVISLGGLPEEVAKAAELGADERDKLFANKGNNFGYTVLAIGVFISLGGSVFLEINPEFIAHSKVLKFPLLTAHILLFSFIFSEVVRFSSQLYYYRRSD